MKAIICVGIPASGKSSFAEAYCRRNGAVKLDRDDLRFSLTGTIGWFSENNVVGYSFDHKIEKMISEMLYTAADEASKYGKDVVVAETNLNNKTRKSWVEYLSHLGYDVFIKEFPITLEEALQRDSERVCEVGSDVIQNMYKKWENYLNNKEEGLCG